MPTRTKEPTTTQTPGDYAEPANPNLPQSLAEAMLLFQSRMPRVAKDQTATVTTKAGGSYSYKYADLAGTQEAALPVLNECGLTFTSQPRRCDDGTYELVGLLNFAPTGETAEGSLPLFTKGTPQELGSAITYARRYLLTCMTGVVAEEDDDGQIARSGYDRATEEAIEATRREAALTTARNQAFARWQAVSGRSGDRNGFVSDVEAEYAQPFVDVTVEQLEAFLGQPVAP